MNRWLLKTDAETYSFDDLVREKRTVWDGVSNPQALGFLGQMEKSDLALIYHSGKEKHIAGLAEVTREAYPDPKSNDAKVVVVELRARNRAAHPVTLAQIKADPVFANFHLVRQPRLSVMPVPPLMWQKLIKMAGL